MCAQPGRVGAEARGPDGTEVGIDLVPRLRFRAREVTAGVGEHVDHRSHLLVRVQPRGGGGGIGPYAREHPAPEGVAGLFLRAHVGGLHEAVAVAGGVAVEPDAVHHGVAVEGVVVGADGGKRGLGPLRR